MSTTKERLQECIKYLQTSGRISSATNFARKTGINPSTISQALAGKHMISDKQARKIEMTFPDINAIWLLKGEGIINGTESIYKRINKIMKQEGLTDATFINESDKPCLIPGIYRASFDQTDRKVMAGYVECLLHIFPKYSPDWILKGEGAMTL